jgi:hypothetical protein
MRAVDGHYALKLRRAASATVEHRAAIAVECESIGGNRHALMTGSRDLQRVAGLGLLQCLCERLSFLTLDLLDCRIGARHSHTPFQIPRECEHP